MLLEILRSDFFVLWWATMLFALVVGTFYGVVRNWRDPLKISISFGNWGRMEWLGAIGLGAYLSVYVFSILFAADVASLDQWQLTDFALRGEIYPVQILPTSGRFFPLHLQEFHLIENLTRDPVGLHSIVILQFFVFLALAYFLLSDLTVISRLAVIGALTLLPGVFVPFSGFVYPERNLLFFLALMAFFVRGFSEGRHWLFLAGALAATQCMLYFKEPAFIIILGFTASRLFWSWRYDSRDVFRSIRTFSTVHVLEIALIILSSIYLVLFLIVLFPLDSLAYVESSRVDLLASIATYARVNPLLLCFFAVLATRLVKMAVGTLQPDRFWDGLAIGVGMYGAAIVSLGLYTSYYMAPADFVGVMYLGRVIAQASRSHTDWRRITAAIVGCCVLAISATHTVFLWYERKGMVSTASELADFLIENSDDRQVRLRFPFGTDADETSYYLMELYSYLDYRGLPVANYAESDSSSSGVIVLETPHANPQNRCASWHTAGCFQSVDDGRQRFDVRSPTDWLSGDSTDVGEDSPELLFVSDRFLVRGLARSVFRYFYSAGHSDPMPDHWPSLRVTLSP